MKNKTERPDAIEPAKLAYTAEGVPYSERYGDVYHSADGGPDQARHVFLEGNRLPWRWRDSERCTILETGFGEALNFLVTWAAFRASAPPSARLHYLSVEKHPFRAVDLASLHGRWPDFAPEARALQAVWPPLIAGFHRFHFDDGRVTLTVLLGDARRLLPRLSARVDAFYLDGFAPEKNPELWSEELCRQLARLAAPNATLATWTVAGSVRERLSRAGFELAKQPGFGRKRQMLVGRYAGAARTAPAPTRRAIIIGAGMTGVCCAERLAARGWEVDLVERHGAPAREASGNPTGVLLPLINLTDTPGARLSRAALLYAARHFDGLRSTGPDQLWNPSGVLQLARDDLDTERHERVLAEQAFPVDFARNVLIEEASALAGHKVAAPGWWFPKGGWLAPGAVCEANLQRHRDRITCRFGQHAVCVRHSEQGWAVVSGDGTTIREAPHLILCNASDIVRFEQTMWLPLKPARGQVTFLPAHPDHALAAPVCRGGYITPAVRGVHGVGATFDRDSDPLPRPRDHGINLDRLESMLPGFSRSLDPARLHGRAAFRATTPDRLPIVGALPRDPDNPGERWAGLHVASGMGARGLVWGPLVAELLASMLEGDPLPVETGLGDAIDPARFIRRSTV